LCTWSIRSALGKKLLFCLRNFSNSTHFTIKKAYMCAVTQSTSNEYDRKNSLENEISSYTDSAIAM